MSRTEFCLRLHTAVVFSMQSFNSPIVSITCEVSKVHWLRLAVGYYETVHEVDTRTVYPSQKEKKNIRFGYFILIWQNHTS